MEISSENQDVFKRRSLNRMKAVATGMLLLMGVVFVVCFRLEPHYPWLGYVKAFSEAAMIGALADWFAVTALFKHPLALPIPHTAIIPKRKDEIGQSLARFIERHFLTTDAFLPRLKVMNFGHKIGNWLQRPENADRLADDSRALVRWVIDSVDNQALRQFLRENLALTLRNVQISPLMGRFLNLLTTADHHQEIVDALVKAARRQLRLNKYKIRAKIDDESPWWLPKFVDEEIYDKIVYEIETVIERLGDDSNHEARAKLNEGIHKIVDSLKTDPNLIAQGEKIKAELLEHPAVEKYLGSLWDTAQNHFDRQLGDLDSDLNKKLRSGIARLGIALQESPEMQAQVNTWVTNALIHLVSNYRSEISGIITDTVERWDGKATSERVELAVGRDLQFIRINGTLVGGLVGLIIYSVIKLF